MFTLSKKWRSLYRNQAAKSQKVHDEWERRTRTVISRKLREGIITSHEAKSLQMNLAMGTPKNPPRSTPWTTQNLQKLKDVLEYRLDPIARDPVEFKFKNHYSYLNVTSSLWWYRVGLCFRPEKTTNWKFASICNGEWCIALKELTAEYLERIVAKFTRQLRQMKISALGQLEIGVRNDEFLGDDDTYSHMVIPHFHILILDENRTARKRIKKLVANYTPPPDSAYKQVVKKGFDWPGGLAYTMKAQTTAYNNIGFGDNRHSKKTRIQAEDIFELIQRLSHVPSTRLSVVTGDFHKLING